MSSRIRYSNRLYHVRPGILILALITFLHTTESDSQVFNKFGIKGGAILTQITLSEYYPGLFLTDPSGGFKYLSIDLGIYGEFFNSRKFSVNAEVHYIRKGEDDNNRFAFLQKGEGVTELQYKHTSNRFQYISFQVLPKWKFLVNTENNMYMIGGPRFDLRISNSNSYGADAVKLDNSGFEFGFTVGIGDEIADLFHFELRYDRNLTNTYSFDKGDEDITRKMNSLSLIVGLSLKKLLRVSI